MQKDHKCPHNKFTNVQTYCSRNILNAIYVIAAVSHNIVFLCRNYFAM